MRCAVFPVTAHGIVLAEKLQKECRTHVFDMYVKEGRPAPDGVIRYTALKDAVADTFGRYDALLFFTALGISVRMIAPHIKSKLTDPAVIVVDEAARHAISVLSGHVGGANGFTEEIAGILDAELVITTATDVNKIEAPDALASKLGLRPYPKSEIQTLNSALVDGKKLRWAIEANMPHAEIWEEKLKKLGIESVRMKHLEAEKSGELLVLLTEKPGVERKGLLYLVSRRLIAGIGCRRGMSKESIRAALESACDEIGQDITQVSEIVSTVVKSDEAGILELAEELGIGTRFFDNETLSKTINRYHLPESAFVKKQIGVGNICEAAALSAVTEGKTALPKTKYTKVTVALIWEK